MIWKACITSLLLVVSFSFPASGGELRVITDMAGRQVTIPKVVDTVLCSGPGCLRYLTYLQGQRLIAGVDSFEKRNTRFDARPYALANQHFKKEPLFGELRGYDNPELILGLKRQPQVIFKTYKNMGYDPDELQTKTGIPVVCLEYGNLASERDIIRKSLLLMGDIIGKQKRAKEVCDFFDDSIVELKRRTVDIPLQQQRRCYIGGVAKKGPHGILASEPSYPSFLFVNANNIAYPKGEEKSLEHITISKEQLIVWDPEIIFLDLATTQLGEDSGAIHEIKSDSIYHGLTAVQEGNVYTVLPYNWYSNNYGSIIADAFFIGKILYPDRFADVDPHKKADEMYTFLVGKPVLSLMKGSSGYNPFEQIQLR